MTRVSGSASTLSMSSSLRAKLSPLSVVRTIIRVSLFPRGVRAYGSEGSIGWCAPHLKGPARSGATRPSSGERGGDQLAQAPQGAHADLAHAALGDPAQVLADLGEGHLGPEAEGHDRALPLGQRVDGLADTLAPLPSEVGLEGVVLGAGAHHLVQVVCLEVRDLRVGD